MEWGHIYKCTAAFDWQSQTEISMVRLDPGIEAGVHFKLDWFALSSEPVSDSLVPDFILSGDKALVAVAGTGIDGEYTLTALYDGSANSITVPTTGGNTSLSSLQKRITTPSLQIINSVLHVKNHLPKSTLRVFNLRGQMVLSVPLGSDGMQKIALSKKLYSGMHLVRLSWAGGEILSSMVIPR